MDSLRSKRNNVPAWTLVTLWAAASLYNPNVSWAQPTGTIEATPLLQRCTSGELVACQEIAQQLSTRCSTPAPDAVCSQLLSVQLLIEAIDRQEKVCVSAQNSPPCVIATNSAKSAEKALAGGPLSRGFKAPPPKERVFNFTSEQKAGDCHTRAGAQLVLSAGPKGGFLLHYTATMYTKALLTTGDVWHVVWHFYNPLNEEVIATPNYNFPEAGGTMFEHQRDNFIDWYGSFDLSNSSAAEQLGVITAVGAENSC